MKKVENADREDILICPKCGHSTIGYVLTVCPDCNTNLVLEEDITEMDDFEKEKKAYGFHDEDNE